ncbi:MAG TPA: glycosyltransferase, partial [Verrucomicrobiae bacterium]|nr:glycosyltransferase [Verrucomicrobiae bacterium]
MKVVLVHDWLIHMRGGERVLESLAELYPDAPIYTLFHDRAKLSPSLRDRVIHSSFLHHLPGIKRYYRWLLPFLPQIIKTLGAKEADLVLSTSHCVAKGVPVPQGALHVCYCHTPMRYLWGFGEDYFGNMPFFLKPVISWILSCLRGWDVNVNKGVDYFISNSHNVAERIRRYYGRESEVIHPPVDTRFFHPVASGEDFYLVVSAFVPYKKVDVVIQAFNELDRPLKIVGAGPLEQAYKSLASAPQIEFLGSVSDEKLRELHSRARALIFPTEEDFGIVPLEAQACGTPVIALKKGGALESVKTGLFFEEQTAECLREAVRRFE